VTDRIEAFIARWAASGASERANYQLFLTELCELLDVPRPDPATSDNAQNGYVFERTVTFHHGDGSTSTGFIDLYRRGAFVLEAKQGADSIEGGALSASEQAKQKKAKQGTARRGTGSWDDAMLRARGQAEQYARALPAGEGRPPFVVVVDVGHSIELYAEFTQSGATYVPYPDPRSHRLKLGDLRSTEVQERLRTLWLDPLALDPARRSARVTRDVAAQLAKLAMSLERSGHGAETSAHFLMRCLFTMFAEDVGLLPKNGFQQLLESLRETPQHFVPLVEELWRTMNTGGFSTTLRADILRFNGGLFADSQALPLTRDQIELLIESAQADWRHVEPSIFGTLLERALDPHERHKLGAHYTPRAYVERLVLPTVIEPLRKDWDAVQAAAITLHRQGKEQEAIDEVENFLNRLAHIRVLDPACGSANFLYVTLEHMKRLEGEVLNLLAELGHTQFQLDTAGLTVDPHQFLGLEVNPRAAAIAEMVLWIGYLQWHFRTHGNVRPPEPVIKNYHNIQCRDAVLAWDKVDYVLDDKGIPVTRWDGRSTKPHPVTGEAVPDESARVPLEQYHNPRKAEWPEADFVVGNPPFIGASTMRRALGDGYVDALRETWNDVPESADYVMYWWHHAADLTRGGKLKRFGFITTNSLRQTFNRRVIEQHMAQKNPLSLVFAVPDHPWVDAADGAAVRIAMTAAQAGNGEGVLANVVTEREGNGEGLEVVLNRRSGVVHADLTAGANVAGAGALLANSGISSPGVKLHGAGFIVTKDDVERLGHHPEIIKDYRNGRDLADRPRDVMIIDLFGLSAEEVRAKYPAIYQWVLERVKPERDQNNRATYRDNWWIFGEARKDLRAMTTGLSRYIATIETTKHRIFQFLDASILPDNMLVNIASDDAFLHGVLSSRLHVAWALATGGRLGVGNDPRYNKTRCLETFPFPEASDAQQARIRALAEQIDAHRKRQQAQHPNLTLTGMYNVLEKLRAATNVPNVPNVGWVERSATHQHGASTSPMGSAALHPSYESAANAHGAEINHQTAIEFTAKEKLIHEHGLISVLAQLHDELDAAVFDAYGWSDLAPALVGRPGGTTPLPDKPEAQAAAEEELLTRLVALNAERAAEEARGLIRWLRPEFQAKGTAQAVQTEAEMETEEVAAVPQPKAKQPWPKGLPDQVQAVRAALLELARPADAEEVARRFQRAQTPRVQEILDALAALGQVRQQEGMYLGV